MINTQLFVLVILLNNILIFYNWQNVILIKKNNTKFKKYEIFKSNSIEFISNAYLCKKIVSEVSLYTDLNGYEHIIEKEINNKEITIKECEDMVKNKFCEFGTLKRAEHSYHTNNKVSIE